FLARHDRLADALAYCEKALEKSPEAALITSVAILRDKPAAAKEHKRVEEWMRKVMEKQSQPGFSLVLAELYDLRGDYPGAMRMYRKVLQKDPENQVALNTLAWFLAMQEKSEESVALMAKLLEISEPVPEFVDTRGVVWLSLNKTSEALRDLAQAA